MKMTVHEAFILAREKLPTSLDVELCLFGDDVLNAKAIVAMADAKKPGLSMLNLISLGLVKDYAGAKNLVEKSRKIVDSLKKL